MRSTTGRFGGSLLRVGAALALSVFTAVASVAPASAADNGLHKGWDKNGKADKKAAKQAARLNQQAQGQQRTIVVDNGTVVDRSRVRASAPTRRSNTNTGARYTYRNGAYYDQYGNRVYDYRNNRTDPYAQYPQYRRNNTYGNYPYNGGTYGNNGYYGNSSGTYGNNGGYYGNSGGYYGNNGGYYGNSGGYYGNSDPRYYSNREGDKDRDDVARAASQNGYYAGFERGQYDAQNRNRPNPQGHGAFQFGYDGFDPSWGSASTYQQYYRQYFVQGYQDGYNSRGYTRQFPRRRY
jgi:hypothetical protein